MTNKEILKQQPYEIYKGSNGCYKTYIKDNTKSRGRHLLVRQTKPSLEQALINHYKQNNIANITVKQLYEKWIIWRKEIGTDTKTIRENSNEWKRFIQDNTFSTLRVKDVKLKHINNLFFILAYE